MVIKMQRYIFFTKTYATSLPFCACDDNKTKQIHVMMDIQVSKVLPNIINLWP